MQLDCSIRHAPVKEEGNLWFDAQMMQVIYNEKDTYRYQRKRQGSLLAGAGCPGMSHAILKHQAQNCAGAL
jgi:hypothetical protein